MIIASIKYGKKRIGQYGIDNCSCIADAKNKLNKYLGNFYQYRQFLFEDAKNVTKQKNYVQDELFKIIN